MMEQREQVCVYIFRNDDGRNASQRLQEAAELYSSENLAGLLRVERTAAGKPYFPDCPKLHFSISHSGAYWACAMGNVNLGLDLQEHVTGKNETKEETSARFEKMARRFFHPVEVEFVERNCYEHFFTVWTAREAYVKNTGQGIDKYFSEHCVVPREQGMLRRSVEEQLTDQVDVLAGNWTALDKWFRKTEFKENYSLCVCAEKAFNWMIQEC